jgi:hypothetical protein
MGDNETAAVTCIVCSEQAPRSGFAQCNWCDAYFHLNQRNDIEAKDCGQVWIDEQFLALQFACNNCLAGEQPTTPTTAPRRIRVSGERRRYKKRS